MLPLLLFLGVFCLGTATVPLQAHISYGNDLNEMVVTYSTSDVQDSVVFYGPEATGKLPKTARGASTKFVDGGFLKHTQYIHRVTLKGLDLATPYSYQIQITPTKKSKIYSFSTRKGGNDWSPKFMVYGDMGYFNPVSLKYLLQEAAKGSFDAVLHNGDFAYNMDTAQGTFGDSFMDMIEPIAANYPYMVSVGNHEGAYNFSHYINRFTMPGESQNFWYSYDIGPAHIISYSTENYFFDSLKPLIDEQYKWLVADLKKANQNRKNIPWIITMGHRPQYCSNLDHDDCTTEKGKIRAALEKLFNDQGVDLIIEAHEHSYERLFPVFNEKVCNGTTDPKNPYHNPRAPTHIISGSAGCQERHDPIKKPFGPWSAFRSDTYGVGRLHILNSTHLIWKQVTGKGDLLDEITLIQNQHGPFLKCT